MLKAAGGAATGELAGRLHDARLQEGQSQESSQGGCMLKAAGGATPGELAGRLHEERLQDGQTEELAGGAHKEAAQKEAAGGAPQESS